jgi:ABC-type transport system involved in multi-copper enzyme maturation permease subunit
MGLGVVGMPFRWLHVVLLLTKSEFTRLVRAPSTLYFFLATAVFFGFAYWLTSTWRIVHFLDFAYVTLPVFFLAVGSALISKERESGFSAILFTYPIDNVQHYVSKSLSVQLLGGLYLIVLSPFDVLIIYFGGSGWVGEILARVLWTLLTTFFVGGLGLFISLSLGRKATLPSVSLGFVTAMMLVWLPFLVFQYLGSFDPSLIPTVLSLLHVSPVMGAMDVFRTHGLDLLDPLLPIAVSGFLSASMFLVGVLVYTKFQSAEGWEAPSRVRIGIPALVVVLLVATPLAIHFTYDYPSPSQSGTVDLGNVQLIMGGIRPTSRTPPPLQTTFSALLTIRVFNDGSEPVTIEMLILRWTSEFFEFNVTTSRLGPIEVAPSEGQELLLIEVPLRVTAVRAVALGTSEFGPFTPIIIELRGQAQGKEFAYTYQDNDLRVAGKSYNRDLAWGVVAILAGSAFCVRASGRFWRRRT